MRRLGYAFCLSLAFALLAIPATAQDNDYFMYVGTYTGFKYVHHSKTWGVGESHSKGIYVSRFHAATGELSEPELAAEVINPSFLTISPNHRFLYAVSEDPLSVGPPLDHSSYVSAFAIDPATGKLAPVKYSSCQRHQHLLHLDRQDRKVRDDGQFRQRERLGGAGQGRRLPGRADSFHPGRRTQRGSLHSNGAPPPLDRWFRRTTAMSSSRIWAWTRCSFFASMPKPESFHRPILRLRPSIPAAVRATSPFTRQASSVTSSAR